MWRFDSLLLLVAVPRLVAVPCLVAVPLKHATKGTKQAQEPWQWRRRGRDQEKHVDIERDCFDCHWQRVVSNH